MIGISSRADVDPAARIDASVSIGPFSVIEADVVIGEGTHIGPHVVIMNGSRIGRHCQVSAGAVIGGIPQDLKFRGEYSTVQIGDHNIIRENVTINRGTQTRGLTAIGDHNLIMANSHLGHDCSLGSHCIVGYSVGIAGEVEIGDYVNISGLTGVHQFSKIGDHAIVGGLSKVNKDVPPYCMAARDPLSFMGLNTVGLKRRGFSAEVISEIHEIYRVLYQSGYNTAQATLLIEEHFSETSVASVILSFLKSSDRGIIKRFGR